MVQMAGIAMYTIPLLVIAFDARRYQGISAWVKRGALVAPLRQTAPDALHTRKLRQAHDEFKVLKELFDNGLITEDVFLQRKDQMKDRLASAGSTP